MPIFKKIYKSKTLAKINNNNKLFKIYRTKKKSISLCLKRYLYIFITNSEFNKNIKYFSSAARSLLNIIKRNCIKLLFYLLLKLS